MVDGPVSGRRIKRRTIRTIVIAVIALVVFLAVVQGVIYLTRTTVEMTREADKAAIEADAKKIADKIAAPLDVIAGQLGNLAQQEKLITLFAAGDKTALEAETKTLTEGIQSALKLRLFLPGQYELDRESKPPLGYASLDLLKQAETTAAAIDAEVHGYGSPDAHIVMTRRVKDADGKLTGLIHLSLSAEPFMQLEGQQAIGYAELVQTTGKSPLVLNKFGNANNRQGEPVKVDVKGARWYITVWGATSTAVIASGSSDSSGMLFIVPALIIAIFIAGFVIYRRKQPATGEDDQVVYAGAIKAIMDGLHPGLERLIPNLPGMGQSKPVKPVSQGLIGDDVTVLDDGSHAGTKIPAGATNKTPPVKAPAQAAKVKTVQPVTAQAAKAGTAQPQTIKAAQVTSPDKAKSVAEPDKLSAEIFRAYDIRGVSGKTLTSAWVYEIGRAIGSEAEARGQQGIVVGRDGRTSSPELADALIRGLRASGRNVIDIGLVPTPVLYFATHHLNTGSGVMITGSHNGPEYNGLKIVLGGETLAGDAIQSLHKRIEAGQMSAGQGDLRTADVTADYIRRASEDIPVALGGAFKLVIDCGNGVAGIIAPQLYRALGHDIVELYCDVDGKFPNHHPDPSQPQNLQALIARVREEQADLGFAFDGDGDRLGVVDGEGNIIWPDRQLMLLARDVLSRNQGMPIIFDVKCSCHLKTIIEQSGGKPLMWKTGHSLIKAKMKEVNAPLAGEMSGHIFFKERWYGFDDAMYAGARLLEILTRSKRKPAEIFAELPGGVATPELRIPLAEKYHAKFMQAMKKKMSFAGAEIVDIDGLRVDFPDGWGLIRPSNTSPCLVARFEAENETILAKIQSEFRGLIQSITPDLKLPF